MRKVYFLIFKAFIFGLQAQYAQYGAEIYSQQSYKYGKFKAVLNPSEKSGYITSFYLYSDHGKGASINFDLSKDASTCYWVDRKHFHEDSLKTSASAATYTIEWTPTTVKCLKDSQLVMEVRHDSSKLSYPMHVGFTLWQKNLANETPVIDTTLSELDSFQYYAYTPTGFELKHTDSFDQLDTKFWTRSTAKYVDNRLQNDTNMLFIDKGKLQLISLGYKVKNYKRFFKRDKDVQSIPYISKRAYEEISGKPCLVLTFSDTIYNVDKNVKNFEIDHHKILKSKLKSDYKTVVLYLDKHLAEPARLMYFPVLGRFRKPQVLWLP